MGICIACRKSLKKKNSDLNNFSRQRESKYFIAILNEPIENDYELVRTLAHGGFGMVYEMENRGSGIHRAVKSIQLLRLRDEDVEKLLAEAYNLQYIDHPGVIRVFEVYRNEKYLYIVTEMCFGGNLFDKIQMKKRLTENIAIRYLWEISNILKFCHLNGIIHGDLKPENILFEDCSVNAKLKIADFGNSTKHAVTAKDDHFIGSPYYTAPEVIKGYLTTKSDAWGLGVIFYIMLSGDFPFKGGSIKEIFKNILTQKIKFKGTVWAKVSECSKNLIKQLLCKDPNKRLSVSDIANNKWVKQKSQNLLPDSKLSATALKNLTEFRKKSKFQTSISKFIAKYHTSIEDTNKIRTIFENIDKDKDGKLSKSELKESFIKYSNDTELDIDQIFNNCDIDNDGFIEFSEFLTAVRTSELNKCKENLKEAFKLIDLDKNGKFPRTN